MCLTLHTQRSTLYMCSAKCEHTKPGRRQRPRSKGFFMTTVNCTVFKETEKAYMFRVNGSTDCFWMPKFVVLNNGIKIHSKKAKIPQNLIDQFNNKQNNRPTKKVEKKEETLVTVQAADTTTKEEAMEKKVYGKDVIFSIDTFSVSKIEELQNFDEALDARNGMEPYQPKKTKEEEEKADEEMKIADKKLEDAIEALTKKEEQIFLFEQICRALKAAIREAKEEGAENENAFSCDVFFDEDGNVEDARVAFCEDRTMCVMYEKNTATQCVDALFDPKYFTEETSHTCEVDQIASAVLSFYNAGEWNN